MPRTIETDRCPTCGGFWAQRRITLRAPEPELRQVIGRLEDEVEEHFVYCVEGHEFAVVRWSTHPWLLEVVVPEPPPLPVVFPAARVDADCPCGRPIQPGQAYVPGREPRHLGCPSNRRN